MLYDLGPYEHMSVPSFSLKWLKFLIFNTWLALKKNWVTLVDHGFILIVLP